MFGVKVPARAIPVSGGADTLIWRVEAAGQISALRLFRPEQAATAQREVVAMAAASSAGLPVPQVYAEGSWRGRPVLHMSWMPGRPLRDDCVPILGGPGRSACSSAGRKPPFMPFRPLPRYLLIPRPGSPGRTWTTRCATACVPPLVDRTSCFTSTFTR